MAIILITGLPGHGKTLYTLARWRDIAQPPPKGEGRPVFHASGQVDKDRRGELHGIPDLSLPWQVFDPYKWQDLPPNAIGIIDEAQFVFPPRLGRGEPPDHISALAVHRHGGRDLVLITQHPSLLDVFVKRLIDRHFHVVRKFGTHWATVYEFPMGVRDEPQRSRAGAIEHQWRYPKDVFALYKSAEAHTVKVRIPIRLWVSLAAACLVPALGWYAFTRLNPENQRQRVQGHRPDVSSPATDGPQQLGPALPRTLPARADLTASLAPRIDGLPFTAPAYDQLTQPAEAPYPAYCISLGPAYPCQCYTQRGTGLEVPRITCESIARNGFFAYWIKRGGSESEPRQQQQQQPSQAVPQSVAFTQ